MAVFLLDKYERGGLDYVAASTISHALRAVKEKERGPGAGIMGA